MDKKKLDDKFRETLPRNCPDCGASLKHYHNADYTNVICSKKCQKFKVIYRIDIEVALKVSLEAGTKIYIKEV